MRIRYRRTPVTRLRMPLIAGIIERTRTLKDRGSGTRSAGKGDDMTSRALLRETTTIARENLLIFVPTISASVLFSLLSLITRPAPAVAVGPYGPGMVMGPGAMLARGWGAAAVLFVVGAIIALLAHAMTLAMVKQSVDGRKPTLASGFEEAKRRVAALAVAAVITGVLVGAGMMLLLLPGLIVSYLLMYTFAAVIASDLGAPAAIKKSFSLATGQFGESAVLFLIIIALGVLFGAASLILNLIPFLGSLIGMILGGLYTGYISVLLLLTYRRLEGPATRAQQEPQPEG